MRISITFDTNHPDREKEIKDLISYLNGFLTEKEEPKKEEPKKEEPKKEEPKKEEPKKEEPKKEEPKKNTRKAKKQEAKPEAKPEEKPENELDLDGVRNYLIQTLQNPNLDKPLLTVKNELEKYEVTKLTDLDSKHYEDFYKFLKNLNGDAQ